MKNEDLLLFYMRGWRDGAKSQAPNLELTKYPEYNAGLHDGRKAAGRAYDKASKFYKVRFSPLREKTGE